MNIEANSPELRAIIDVVRETTMRELARSPKKKWMEQQEVEVVYSIKKTQLWELRKSGLVKVKKLGSKVLVSVESLEGCLNS